MSRRKARVGISVLLFTLVLTAAGACGRKAKPEPLRSAAVVIDRSDRILQPR